MIAEIKLMTAEEFFEQAHQDKRSELVRGEVVEMPPASEEHGSSGMELSWRLAQYIRHMNLGKSFMAETGFVLAHEPDIVRAPDFAFVTKARWQARVKRGAFFDGAPDLAVEVASPSKSAEDIKTK